MACVRAIFRACPFVVALSLLPVQSWAERAIAGQIEDNTGAVLHGVNVEAASLALIEGVGCTRVLMLTSKTEIRS